MMGRTEGEGVHLSMTGKSQRLETPREVERQCEYVGVVYVYFMVIQQTH